MPASQLEVTDARRHRLRHVKPYNAGEGLVQSTQTFLGRSYGFEELPISQIPTSRDFSEASWTGRLGDAGQADVKFPNKEASDGKPWRNRFSTFGHLEFIEIYRDDVLEHVDVILTSKPDQQSVLITGQDGWFLLREAYERNYVCVMAPRDVIERASYVWIPTLASNLTALPAGWSEEFERVGTGEATITFSSVGCKMRIHTEKESEGPRGVATLKSSQFTIPANGRWRLVISFTQLKAEGAIDWSLFVQTPTGSKVIYLTAFQYMLKPTEINPAGAKAGITEGGVVKYDRNVTMPFSITGGPHTLQMESDGRFVRVYLDGYFINEVPAIISAGESAIVALQNGGHQHTTAASNINEILVTQWLLRQAEPLLMRGSEKGDYVLPGAVQTYPYGGLTGRFYNDLDLQETPEYWRMCFAQERSLNKQIQYQDRTDQQIGSPEPPLPGASTTFWSVRYFGSVYLKLSQGNYTFKVGVGGHVGVRLWVGKTQLGEQIIDQWQQNVSQVFTVTLNAASLGGKDGWYPIILECFVSNETAGGTVSLRFTPPVSYTDPGGTALVGGIEINPIPSTSLSPLGCVDQHYQGQSHFNIAKEAAEAFGYQMQCEPRQLESGEFPGQLVPKARVGRDTDEILESDSITSRSPVVNYSNLVDATDQATSLLATGSGLPNGQNGQISAEEFDIPTMLEALFDLQGWVDAADINSPSLLAARVAAQLSLQLEPWQNIEGEPLARDRLADTFPLTGVLSAMRWRPGDGIRIYLPDINVIDTTPRQILQVTRQFGPIGRHGTQMGFRQRPLDRLSQVNHQLRRALQPQRNYQRTILGLPCTQLREEIAAGAEGAAWSLIPILISDTIIDAQLLILNNTTGQPLHVIFNGSDVTTEWGGPWSKQPVAIKIRNLRPEAGTAGGRQAAYVRIKNVGAAATFVEAIPIIRVLR